MKSRSKEATEAILIRILINIGGKRLKWHVIYVDVTNN